MAKIDEIAAEAGVSKWTVARVLGGETDYARPTFARRAERIRQIAARMGYLPNAAARATATGRFGAVTLLLSTRQGRGFLPEPLLEGIHDALAERNLHLNVARLPDESAPDSLTPKQLREWSCDGLLINFLWDIPQRLLDRIRRYELPTVWINTKQQADCVYLDDEDAARRATRYLLELGHRRIAYAEYHQENRIGTPHYSILDRRAGYEQAMREAGWEPMLLGVTHPVPYDSASEYSRKRLRSPDRPTAVLAYDVAPAVTLMDAARALGLRIPKDLSIMTFTWGGTVPASLCLSQMWLPEVEMGRVAVEMLAEKMKDRRRPQPARAVPCTLLPNRTTGPAPQ